MSDRSRACDDNGPESDLALAATAEALASLATADNEVSLCRVPFCPNPVIEEGLRCAACAAEGDGDEREGMEPL